MEFYASCPTAFEQALARELREMGIRRVRPLKGRVAFEGEMRDAYRACLWSHLASRIHVVLDRFACKGADDLYQGVYDMPWHEILRRGAKLAVSAHGTNQELRNTRFSMLRAKDAIVDRISETWGSRPSIDAHEPDAHIALNIRGDRATVTLDLSGDALFKRIPRAVLARATRGVEVLRSDYAAFVLAEGGWPELCRAHAEQGTEPPLLIDLACADGGVLLEAASWLSDRAPNIARTRWGFQGWAAHDPRIWRSLLAEARDRHDKARARGGRIIATDIDPRAISASRRLIDAAQPPCTVEFVDASVPALRASLGRRAPNGLIVADTSIMSPDAAAASLRFTSAVTDLKPCRALAVSCLARDEAPLRIPGRAPSTEAHVVLGSDTLRVSVLAPESVRTAQASGSAEAGKASVDRADGGAPERAAERRATVDVGDGKPVPVLVPASEQFARRLIRVARQRRRWAKRAGITCYRVYDADLPDYAAAIDLYVGDERTPGRWLVIAEYAAPKTIDPELAQMRMLDILAIAPRVLGVPGEHVHAKTRRRARGGSQYARKRETGSAGSAGEADALIQEGGLTFAVNFDEYLDTGIFLDHRTTRGLVRERARNARTFLNLFAYTGTATCYAADAGVAETVTVDLSNTYLDWAARNMDLNGFTGANHHFVRSDVLSWVHEQVRGTNRWDLIFCDPPTFSNSSAMGTRTWDVQRDHVELLDDITRLLEPDGEVIFSCNLRSFKPDTAALSERGIELADITAQTIPDDFARNPRIHHCYLVTRP